MSAEPFFEWDPALELGIEEADGDHKRFFTLLGKLRESIAAGAAPELLYRELREVANCAMLHFFAEEELLEESGCPELLRQRGEHAGLLEHLTELEMSVAPLTLGATERIRDWMLEHIRTSDRGYAGWLQRARRAKAEARKLGHP